MVTRFNIIICLLIFVFSCTKDIGKSPSIDKDKKGVLQCDTVPYTYNVNIKNIITNQCAGCHFSGSPDGALTDHLNLQAKALNGSLMGSLTGQGYILMPLTGRLNDCDIEGIEKWIQAGAPNN